MTFATFQPEGHCPRCGDQMHRIMTYDREGRPVIGERGICECTEDPMSYLADHHQVLSWRYETHRMIVRVSGNMPHPIGHREVRSVKSLPHGQFELTIQPFARPAADVLKEILMTNARELIWNAAFGNIKERSEATDELGGEPELIKMICEAACGVLPDIPTPEGIVTEKEFADTLNEWPDGWDERDEVVEQSVLQLVECGEHEPLEMLGAYLKSRRTRKNPFPLHLEDIHDRD